jgi:glycosyltransferase involved in cell wall biosynthesis
MSDFKTARGRRISVIGDPALLTLDRITVIGDRFDTDPRIASVSVMSHPRYASAFLRSTAPAGCLIAVAQDAEALVGGVDDDVAGWARRASDRGLWHDWWLSNARDVARAEVLLAPAQMDLLERENPSGSHYLALTEAAAKVDHLTITIDATWLGPHETGAQVLTTAAVAAMADDDRVTSITLVGLEQLPSYAAHLTEHPKVKLADLEASVERADVMWYPNQIDQRSNIADARIFGRRIVTTYLDLIAYDIPRYHASSEAWAAYRALQRTIALSVDGITTISADVAAHLLKEVPRLDPERVFPLPLGLDHVTNATAPDTAPDELADIVKKLGSKRFVLVLGNDFQHKNRDFAIQVWEKVLQNGEPCDLVLAGLHVKSSSSKEAEDDLLARHVDLRGTAHTIGHVTSASRAWLLANAAVVLYPSTAEGFGLVPYEAAALGTPSTFTRFGPLAEIANVTDVPKTWSVDAYTEDITSLLRDEDRAAGRVAALQQSIAHHTWAGFARQLVDFFVLTAQRPAVLTSALGSGAAGDSAELAALLSSKTWRATAPLRKVGSKLRGRN